ncbi:MAG: HTTM domain-containing protein [Deltaproteobacteria bacterium]|nr:HTTM domain-containing protein [Deltaproteobacteria bacterium]
MLTKLGESILRWSSARDPWTNVYGVARTLIATSLLLTLLFNDSETLFPPATGIAAGPLCMPGTASEFGFYCQFESMELARWISIGLLAVIASGWRPRLTGVLHWWLTASLVWNSVLADGGEQVGTVLTLLLIPVTITDPRKWHWRSLPPRDRPSDALLAQRLVALCALVCVRIQMAVLYFHAAAGKFEVDEWADGTVLYYWFMHPTFGLVDFLRELAWPLVTEPTVLAVTTWSVLVLEPLLAAGLLVDRKYWRYFLVAGVVFHTGIFVIHGIPSFVMVMFGGLILFFRPIDQLFRVPSLFRKAFAPRGDRPDARAEG